MAQNISSNPILTIAITTYNSGQLIKSSLENIDRNLFKIVVVDNASADDTIKIIEENFPDIEIIKNSKNIGFGRANNMVLNKATTDFALVLNVDAIITKDDILKTIEILKSHPEIALAGNIVHNADYENSEIKNVRPCPKNLLQLSTNQQSLFYENKFITGAGMFMNMAIMRKIGFFDEGFFLYCEDNEICKRVLKKGFKTAIIKDTKLIHLGAKSSVLNLETAKKIYWHKFGWSKLYYTQKIHGRFLAILKAIRMIVKFSLKILQNRLTDKTKNPLISLVETQGLRGCIDYLKGLKAFDENDNPRG